MMDQCGHDDYVLVSCLPGSAPPKMHVRARCRQCEHEVEIKDAEITGVDYPPPTEGIVVTEVEMERAPGGNDDEFADWVRTVMGDD